MRLKIFPARHHKTKTNASSSQQMPDSQRQENRNTITSGNSTSSSGSSSSSVNGKSAANTKPVPAQASTEIRHAHSLWSLAFTGRLGRSSPLWLRHLKSSQRAEAAVTTRERSQRSHGSLVLRALASSGITNRQNPPGMGTLAIPGITSSVGPCRTLAYCWLTSGTRNANLPWHHLCGTVTTCHHRARCRAEVHVLLCRLRRKRCLRHPGIAPAQSIPKSSQAADILLAACTRKILTQGTFAFSSSSSSSSVNGRSAVNTKPVPCQHVPES